MIHWVGAFALVGLIIVGLGWLWEDLIECAIVAVVVLGLFVWWAVTH